tara:strand:- start:2969 stop:3709 length:741 start_codon:yes stop_codon:yes gene_type:complete
MKITKKELREVIQEVAEELGLFEGLTAAQEKLPEPLKKAILKKQGNSDSSDDETEDVEEGLTAAQEKLPEPLKKAILKKQGNTEESDDDSDDDSEEESIEEGNAFGAAVKAARENGDKEFEVAGKKYKLKEKKEITEQEDTEEFTGEDEDEDDVEEGNAFGAAVKKAKEDGDTEFEVDGKTYKVSEDWSKIKEVSDCSYEEDDEDIEEKVDAEFEVGGKTYKVRENWTKITLAEKLDRILGNRKIL